MKRLISTLLTTCIVLFSICGANSNALSSVDNVSSSAAASILYCVDNGKILYSHNENTKMKMASTTKMMTTLLTLEYMKGKDKIITFKESMVEEGSSMYLKIGEKVHISDLCVGMMLPSGNDAASAAAITIAGSKEKFASLMNKRAKSIGMSNSHFVTPSGLDDPNHYSTAHDMALLMTECLKNKSFREISKAKDKTVSFVSPSKKVVSYHNHNRLLSDYSYCISGKTGYTDAAGRCLVTASYKDGITLVAVTLNDRNDWLDHKALYDYGFSQLTCKQFKSKKISQPVVGGENNSVEIIIPIKKFICNEDDSKIKRKIMLEPFAYAPVKRGDRAGMVLYIKDNKVIDKKIIKYNSNVKIKKSKGGFFAFLKNLFQ